MHYDYDYDNDKKQDTNSVLKKFFLAYPTSSRDEIQTDFADNVFFQIKPRHSTQDDEWCVEISISYQPDFRLIL